MVSASPSDRAATLARPSSSRSSRPWISGITKVLLMADAAFAGSISTRAVPRRTRLFKPESREPSETTRFLCGSDLQTRARPEGSEVFAAEREGFKQVEVKPVVAYLTGIIHRISATVGWLALGFVTVATLVPMEARPSVAGPHLEHFAAFALIGLGFALGYPN